MKKKNLKEKLCNLLKSYKTIIYISFIINIILLILLYNLTTSNKVYSFSGNDDYLRVKDGIVVFNNDINLFNGNNIEYIYGEDYEIKSYKIGYYVMDDTKLVEIFSTTMQLDTEIKISEIINNFTAFNLTEKNSNPNYFTRYKKDLINDGIYLVMEATTKDGVNIFSKVNLNVSKISKFWNFFIKLFYWLKNFTLILFYYRRLQKWI